MKETLNNYKEKVDKRLLIRQIMFFIIIFILIIISTLNILENKIGFGLSIGGFLVATIIGLLLSRMFKISWHEEKGKVVSKLDTLGIILLILYIGVEMGRNWLFGHWLSGATLTAFGLIILTGLLLGRFLGTLHKINKVLMDDNTSN